MLSPRKSRPCCLHRGRISSLLNIPCSKICYIHSSQLLLTFFTLPVLEMPCIFPCAKRRPHLDAACHSHEALSSATIITFRYNSQYVLRLCRSLRQLNSDSYDFVPHHAHYQRRQGKSRVLQTQSFVDQLIQGGFTFDPDVTLANAGDYVGNVFPAYCFWHYHVN